MKRNSIKLDDEKVRRFICDGVLVLDSDVAPAVNQQIFEKIQWNNTREFNMGNNVLPRIAELQHVLDAPVIHGALQSILGDDYILHPHRYMHASEPLDEAGAFVPVGDPYDRRWNDIACVPQDEAYALGAMGEVAVGPLIELLKQDDAWIKINAAFALGEIGASAGCAIADLAELLDHELHQVARTILDAIAFIGANTRVALPAIQKLLTVDNPCWQEHNQRGGWTGENQVRFNALCALLNSDIPVAEFEDLLIANLDDAIGYIPALALEALTCERGGENRQGLRRALDYLKLHRWDDTLANGQRVY